MASLKQYKTPLITIIVVSCVLLVMIAVGFTIGILSGDPDGLERVLIDAHGEEWVESLPVYLQPILGWLTNDYVRAIIGISLTVIFIIGTFYAITYIKKTKYAEKQVI